MRRLFAPLLALAVAGCGDGATRTVVIQRVAPSVDPACGAPADARTITITALGDFPPDLATGDTRSVRAGAIEIDRFPEDTRVLELRVEGPGGEERTIGRTAEIVLADLEDGDPVFVFMAPRRGFCPVDSMGTARADPLVARAGDRVIVAGGVDADGAPVDLVELYDPTRGRFESVAGSFYAPGLAGASMTALADGRVVVAGGPQTAFQVFTLGDSDPFGPALLLENGRTYHAAAALSDGRVLLAGGCGDALPDGTCDFDEALLDSIILDVDAGEVQPGPSLSVARAGATAVVEADGRVLISGGVDAAGQPVTQAERIDPLGGAPSVGIGDVRGALARMSSGAVLAAFATGVSTDAVRVIPPGSPEASAQSATAPVPRSGMTLTGLDDSAVLIVGGVDGDGAEAAVYVPADERVVDLATAPSVARRRHGAVRLDDGTVLVVGGEDASGDALADAWVYRHDLTARFTSEFSLADPAQERLLAPRDPARVAFEVAPERYIVSGRAGAGGLPSEWVIASGPQFVAPTVTARAGVLSGDGLAVLFGFRDERTYYYAELVAGAPARVRRIEDGEEQPLGCAGQVVTAAALDATSSPPTIEVAVDAERIRVQVGADVAVDCSVDEPAPRGHVGVGVIGDATASVRVDFLSATR